MIGLSGQAPGIQSKQFLPVKRNNNDRKDNENVSAKTVPNKLGPTCYNCREIGHISRNCPKPQKKPRDPVNIISNSGIKTNNVIVDNIRCNALIDSGSVVSLIRKSIVAKLKCGLVKCDKRLQGFAGGEYKCVEKTLNVNVIIDEQCFSAELFVVDDETTQYEVIIGLDILLNGRVIIENGNCQVYAIRDSEMQCGDNIQRDEKKQLAGLLNKYVIVLLII